MLNAFVQVWREYEPRTMPVLVMNVVLPPQYYDINLSTDKKQILLFKEDVLFVAFQEVFRSAVDASNTHMQVTSVVTPIPSFFDRQKESERKREVAPIASVKSVVPVTPVKSMISVTPLKSVTSITPLKSVTPITPTPFQSRKRLSPSSLETPLPSQPEKRATSQSSNSSILTLISSDTDSFNSNISLSSILSHWNTIHSHISPTKPKSLLHSSFAESQSECSDPSQSVVETELTLELSKVIDLEGNDM